MSRRLITCVTAFVLALLGVTPVLAETTHENRLARKDIKRDLHATQRYVDLSVLLEVVVADESGKRRNGRPALRVVRTHSRGGLYDTLTKRFAGPALKPLVLQCSLQQEEAILHDPDGPAGVWMQGGKGSGKSFGGCVWLTFRVIEHAQHDLVTAAGVTSPTHSRMENLRLALFGSKKRDGTRSGGMWPSSWYSWREGDQTAVLCTNLSINFVSAHISSEVEGSRHQGFNWSFHLGDEAQDWFEQEAEIIMRGRSAYDGRFQRCATATPKRSSTYRTFRDRIGANPDWRVFHMRGPDSPFADQKQWERAARGMSPEQFKREALGEDVPGDNIVYTEWLRSYPDGTPANLSPVPRVPNWPDVTARELSRWGRYELLIGYDPGRIWDVSVLLKAYQPPAPRPTTRVPRPALPDPVWFVVGEVSTKRSTTERHCVALLKVLRDRWGLNLGGDSGQAFVRGDPTTKTGTDEEQPDRNVYRVFEQFGFAIKAAVYKPGSIEHGRVPKNGRIDLVNSLLCNHKGERRLVVLCDDSKKPAAPMVVESFERQELDHTGKAEMGAKDESDLTHWACAVGYALWSIESGRISQRAA